MNIICMVFGHRFKYKETLKEEDKYFFIDQCVRCLKKKLVPSIVNNMKVKCSTSCPTCHGKG